MKNRLHKLSIILIGILGSFTFTQAQIKITSQTGTFDTLKVGTLINYQYSWDDPLDEDYPVEIKVSNTLKAFETIWDSAFISDGSVYFISSTKSDALMVVDGTGWDLIDRGYLDTINFPNISPITLSTDSNEIEWMNFGFYRELDSLNSLPSNGSLKISIDQNNKVNIIFGDFSMVRPDICFEGFGGLRPSVTYVDTATGYNTWFIYGNPLSPTIDTLSDSALNALPIIGQKFILDFNKTNSIRKVKNNGLVLYPNPAKDVINIAGNYNFTSSHFQVITMDGKVVMNETLNGNKINIETLKNGNYILKINRGGQNYYSRFVKN